MLQVTISYKDLIKQINKIMTIANLDRYDDCWLIVTRGDLIADYMPIVDICIADPYDNYLEMNQEIAMLSDVYDELEKYDQKVLTIDKGSDNLDAMDGKFNYYSEGLISMDFLPYMYFDYYPYKNETYDFIDEDYDDDFFMKALEMCVYLDDVDNLKLNESNYEMAYQLAKRLMRLIN